MTHPPLLKPRHNGDGRLYTADEIQSADAQTVRQLVGVCVMGWRWCRLEFTGFDFLFGPHEENKPLTSFSAARYPINPCPNWDGCTPHWSTNIADAFEVDRPEWRWSFVDSGDEFICDVSVVGIAVRFEQVLDHKPTPVDHALARCKAALLLALEIGE